MSKEDKDQYIKDIALLCCVTMHKQGKIPLENITKEEKMFFSELDPKPNLNKDKDLYLEQT